MSEQPFKDPLQDSSYSSQSDTLDETYLKQTADTKHIVRFYPLASGGESREEQIQEVVEVKKLFTELQEKYRINFPVQLVIGKDEQGREGTYSVVKHIEGKNVSEFEMDPEDNETYFDFSIQLDILYDTLVQYYVDKYKSQGFYLHDLAQNTQYVYGTLEGTEERYLYHVDADVFQYGKDMDLVNLRQRIKLIMDSMGEMEDKYGFSFPQATDSLRAIFDEVLLGQV